MFCVGVDFSLSSSLIGKIMLHMNYIGQQETVIFFFFNVVMEVVHLLESHNFKVCHDKCPSFFSDS